ncbi:TadE family protein, partial [Streptomyces sp. DT225]
MTCSGTTGFTGMPAALGRRIRRRVEAARRRAAAGGDSGMTAIEFVLLTPVLFFMIFATVQFALYFFADHVAQAAAQAGARHARAPAPPHPGGGGGGGRGGGGNHKRPRG